MLSSSVCVRERAFIISVCERACFHHQCVRERADDESTQKVPRRAADGAQGRGGTAGDEKLERRESSRGEAVEER